MDTFPFEPRPMAELKGRITLAIARAGNEGTIGAKNVFDTLDGFRLIIWTLQAGRADNLRILVQSNPLRLFADDERDDALVRAAQLYLYLKPNEWPANLHVVMAKIEDGRFTAVLRTGKPSITIQNACQHARNGANDGSESVANPGGQRKGS